MWVSYNFYLELQLTLKILYNLIAKNIRSLNILKKFVFISTWINEAYYRKISFFGHLYLPS